MDKATFDGLLQAMLESSAGVSDLLFICGKPPLVENYGQLAEFPVDTGHLDQPMVQKIAGHLMNGHARLQQDFERVGSCDCSYSLDGSAHFRVNIFRQHGRHAVVMRKLPSEIPTIDSLGLPAVFREMVTEKTGIIVVTGSTGSGKTTTLAALVNEINTTQQIHIVTLEDPIEFRHVHKQAAISQRELGNDFPTFADGLRAAMRQAPKVILVGEIRDRESMDIALSASETGHLVFATLHTISASQTVNRILGLYERDEQQQIRQRLADTLRFVASQRLVQKNGGGRLLVTEVMGSNLRTRETIVYGESENKSFQEIIEASCTLGWHSFDQQLFAALDQNQISEEIAMLNCTNKGRMRQKIDLLRKQRGAVAEADSGLKMEHPVSVDAIVQAVENAGPLRMAPPPPAAKPV
ncbi:MAG: PilT/PilU family type 4a pilus ATPase [Verrucomicrobiota bacterium]|nr:PilT/PilU family type 4a pilus ATPase [Verrucomicrobiota bacterium]